MNPVNKTHKQASSLVKWAIRNSLRLGGRKLNISDAGWLLGPIGLDDIIGDTFYKKFAYANNLSIGHDEGANGLVEDFSSLKSDEFSPEIIQKEVQQFYEQTGRYTMDMWSEWKWPIGFFSRTLIRIVSRDMQQFNLPLSALETGKGMTSEVIKLNNAQGKTLYSCWLRQMDTGNTIYSGFYSVIQLPGREGVFVKVVFPVPRGCTTVILRPKVMPDNSFLLDSSGDGFGDAGCYRIHKLNDSQVLVKHLALKETLHVYVDKKNILRTDHHFKYMGMPMLHLHYKMTRK